MQAMRSHKFTGKHSFRLSVWNPMSQGREDDSIDTLMRRLYVMPKQSSRLVYAGNYFADDEDEQDDEDEASILASNSRSVYARNMANAGNGETIYENITSMSSRSRDPLWRRDSNLLEKDSIMPGTGTIFFDEDSQEFVGRKDSNDGDDEDDSFEPKISPAHRVHIQNMAFLNCIQRTRATVGHFIPVARSEAGSLPRSEKTSLATQDESLLSSDFDATLYIMRRFSTESFESEKFHGFVERELREKDMSKVCVITELATRVEANYQVLIQGMKNVHEIGLYLKSTSMQTWECRRRLNLMDCSIRKPFLAILQKSIRRENLKRIQHVLKRTRTVLILQSETKTALKSELYQRAVAAATNAKLALDSDVLKGVTMLGTSTQALNKLLPEVRLAVDRRLRHLCSIRSDSSAAIFSTEYAWILRAYNRLDAHGIRLSSKPRSTSNPSPSDGASAASQDSLNDDIVPVAPAVDKGGITGLSERIQRFTAMELEYCTKVAIIKACTVPISVSQGASVTDRKGANVKDPSENPSTFQFAPSLSSKNANYALSYSKTPHRPENMSCNAPVTERDVHGRIVAFKGMPLNLWTISDLIKQLRPRTALLIIRELAQQATELLHRFFLLLQWHRSPYDSRNTEESFLHRSPHLVKRDSEMSGGLSDDEDEDEEEHGTEGSFLFSARQEVPVVALSNFSIGPKGGSGSCDQAHKECQATPPAFPELSAVEVTDLPSHSKDFLMRARLSVVAKGLRQARKQLWLPLERTVIMLLNEQEVNLDGLVEAVATVEMLIALGEEFGNNDPAALRFAIHTICVHFREKMHHECFGAMQQAIDREIWYNVPIPVEEFGGVTGIIKNYTQPLAWPFKNGFGRHAKERVQRKSGGESKSRSQSFSTGSTPPILASFPSSGNPFLIPSTSEESASDPTLYILPFPADLLDPMAPDDMDNNEEDPRMSPTLPSVPSNTVQSPFLWTITQASLNGFAKHAGRYFQLMQVYPITARETYDSLLQLLDYYVYMVFAIFVPEQSAELLLSQFPQLNKESSFAEEMSWASQDIHIPLPVEMEQETSHLKSYLTRVHDNFIEEDCWGLGIGLETADRIRKLGADTAKKINAMAAATGVPNNFTMSAVASRVTSPRAGVNRFCEDKWCDIREQHSDTVGEDSERDGEKDREYFSGANVQPRFKIRKVRFQRPASIQLALEDPHSLHGLSYRAIAVESCFFLLEIVKKFKPYFVALIQEHNDDIDSQEGGDHLQFVEEAIAQLRTFIYRCTAPRLVRASSIVRLVESQVWHHNVIREEANPYTERICVLCRRIWEKIRGPEERGSAKLDGLDNMYIPSEAKVLIWTEVAQCIMGTLLEGFSRIDKCSTEGRSLMSMDLQAIQVGLDEILRVRPARGRAYVENYIKAFYYGQVDVMSWVEKNYKFYHYRHIAGLFDAAIGQKRIVRVFMNETVQLYHSLRTETSETEKSNV